MGGDFGLAWDSLQQLLYVGFCIGVVLMSITALLRLGWKHSHVIAFFALAIYFLY